MTTDNFISKVNALNGVYAEILVKERVLNFFCRPQSTEVAEDVLRELFRLICDYQEEK